MEEVGVFHPADSDLDPKLSPPDRFDKLRALSGLPSAVASTETLAPEVPLPGPILDAPLATFLPPGRIPGLAPQRQAKDHFTSNT